MLSWQDQVPAGMFLKSEGHASSLYDPRDSFTLSAYCAEVGLPYKDVGHPVPLETFVAYGRAFQERSRSRSRENKCRDYQENGAKGLRLQQRREKDVLRLPKLSYGAHGDERVNSANTTYCDDNFGSADTFLPPLLQSQTLRSFS